MSTLIPDGQSNIENVQNLSRIVASSSPSVPSVFTNAETVLANYFGNLVPTLNDAFSAMSNINTPEAFFNFIASFPSDPTQVPPVTIQDVKDAFYQDYQDQTFLIDSSWSSLTPNPSAVNPNSPTHSTYGQEQFESWFTSFLTTFPAPTPGTGEFGAPSNFFTTASAQLSVTALLDVGSAPGFTLPKFEQIYDAYFRVPGDNNPTAPGSPTHDNFLSYLNNFYNQQLQENGGFFIPSQSFATFVNGVQFDYANAQGPSILSPPSSLQSADFDITSILNRIYHLIAGLVGIMQNVAAVQANRLTLLTDWQQAYTVELNQLQNFLSADVGKRLPGGLTQDQLSDLNNEVMLLRQNVQTNQSVVGDDAKALQSNVNQSTDAVTQQANMATTILQNLSALLGAIYR